jgi:2-iminobutanoate/2-iminopropanoate deaminase
MKRPSLLLSVFLLIINVAFAQERKVIVPVNSAKPVGPYSPGISIGDYLYVSGQGIRDANNQMATATAAQAKQCLENVKAIVEAGGLTMEHVVHMQLYLERLSDLPEVEKVYAAYFPNNPPARVILSTAKMPTDTPIEMTAVAVRDLKTKKVLTLKSLKASGHASPAIAVGNRIYLSGIYGKDKAAAQRQLKLALGELKATELFHNEYGTDIKAPVAMKALPDGASTAYSVVALRPASNARTQKFIEDGCNADGKTIYCQIRAACACDDLDLPGEVAETFKLLQTALAKHGATLAHVVATNVYLNDIGEFKTMNDKYASFFSAAPPTRTTVQAFAKTERNAGGPPYVRISLVAVKD